MGTPLDFIAWGRVRKLRLSINIAIRMPAPKVRGGTEKKLVRLESPTPLQIVGA